jgi:hypothetical protein
MYSVENHPIVLRKMSPPSSESKNEQISILLVYCLAYSSAPKMEVICYSETSVNFQRR